MRKGIAASKPVKVAGVDIVGFHAGNIAAEGVVHTAPTFSEGGVCEIEFLAGWPIEKLMTLRNSRHTSSLFVTILSHFVLYDFSMCNLDIISVFV